MPSGERAVSVAADFAGGPDVVTDGASTLMRKRIGELPRPVCVTRCEAQRDDAGHSQPGDDVDPHCRQKVNPAHPATLYSSRVTPSRCSSLDFETTTVDEIFDRLLPPLASARA